MAYKNIEDSRENAKEYYAKPEVKDKKREYQRKNKDKINEYHRRYYSSPEWKAWYKQNRKEWYEKNKEKRNKQIIEYQKRNKDKVKIWHKKSDKKYYEKARRNKGDCIDCGKAIVKGSPRCKSCASMNEKNGCWKGGISKLCDRIRNSDEYKKWRIKVFKRDNWACCNHHRVGGTLNVHHIKEMAIIIKENNIKTMEEAIKCKELWDVNNGVTLCIDCHREVHQV